MSDLAGVKPGDILAVKQYGTFQLERVERVTPSGRVKCRSGEFNPNGLRRGHRRNDGFGGYCSARVATVEDIAQVERDRRIAKLRAFPWDKLGDDDLKLVCGLIASVT